MTPSALFAVALSDGDLHATAPSFRAEWQVTPDGRVRINHPPAAPFDPFAADEPVDPSRDDQLSTLAEQYGDRDRDERGVA